MKLVIAALISSVAFIGAANAADVVFNEPPVPMVEEVAFSWSGFYVGAFGGLSTGDAEFEATDGIDSVGIDISASGAFGGAQIGYDWQVGAWVFGAVADIAATNYGADIDVDGAFGDASAESELQYLGTVRGRLGYAVDRTLFYGHGGYAYGEMEQNIDLGGTTVFDESQGKSGFVVGGGIEHAFTDRISFQTEYSYVDLGSDEVFEEDDFSVEEDTNFHSIKAAINFRF